MRVHHGRKIAYELRCAIVTCRLIYGATYEEIERKTGRGTQYSSKDLWGPGKSLVRPKSLEGKGASKKAQKKARLVGSYKIKPRKLVTSGLISCNFVLRKTVIITLKVEVKFI